MYQLLRDCDPFQEDATKSKICLLEAPHPYSIKVVGKVILYFLLPSVLV